MRRELIQRNPDLVLKPFSTKIYKNRIIINGDVSADKGIEDIIIIDTDDTGLDRIIMSDHAKMIDGELQEGLLTLSLDNVFSLSANTHNQNEFEYFTSDFMKYNILFNDMQTSNSTLTPEEMRSIDIYTGILKIKEKINKKSEKDLKESINLKSQILEEYKELSYKETFEPNNLTKILKLKNDYLRLNKPKTTSRELLNWQIGLYQKILIPLSCLSFLLLAFPLGLTSRRSGRVAGFGVGLFITIVYWSLLMATKIYAYKGIGNTLFIMAIPNLFVLLITAVLIPIRFKK